MRTSKQKTRCNALVLTRLPLALVFSMPMLGGCTVGSDYERPSIAHWEGDRFAYGNERQHGVTTPPEIDRWWERFGDQLTNDLVEEAAFGNLEIGVAAANLLEARALLRAFSGEQLPSVDLGFSYARSFSGTASTPRQYRTSIQPSVTVSWQSDLFGRLRRQAESLDAEFRASEEDYVSTAHSVIAEVVALRADLSVAQRRLALAQEIVGSRENTLVSTNRLYRQGAESVSAVDVRLAQENLLAARSDLPDRQRQLEVVGLALDVLLGRVPGTSELDPELLAPLPFTAQPPLGLPAQLVDRRPDLRASAFRVVAANAGVGVEVADLYPNLVVSGTLGFDHSSIERLFDADELFGSIVGDLAYRVFAGGAIRAEIEAAEARYAAQATAYASVVLNAVQEVNTALVNERRLREQIELLTSQTEAAFEAESLARDRYARGLGNLLTVLDTERRRRAVEDQLLRLQGEVWRARVDLHLALGGDWEVAWRDPNIVLDSTNESMEHNKLVSVSVTQGDD